MKFILPRLLPALSLLAFTLALPIHAAEEKREERRVEPVRRLWTFNVDFPGGSLEQLVKSVSSGGAAFNVVGDKAELATPVPPLSLRNADHESLAQGLNQLLSPRGIMLARVTNQTITDEHGQVNIPIYVVTRRSMPTDPVSFESFQLGPFLEKQSVEDIVGAIRTLWELNPANKAEALQIKFHPPTKLLLVSGSSAAINTAAKVISNLARPDSSKDDRASKR